MPFLDAALAFAITIFVVAIAVTQINNLIQKLSKVRRKQMKILLTDYFKNELEPVIKREVSRMQITIKTTAADKFEKMAADLTEGDLFSEEEISKIIDVSTEEIVERIKRSELGDKLLQKYGDEAKTIFNELGKRYEVIGLKYTESFRKHSRLWATGVAVVLALILNIDCIFIANTYIKSENIREGVIVQMNDILSDYETKVATLDSVPNTVLAEDIRNSLDENKKQINVLTHSGFPIGPSYFPHVDFIRDVLNKTTVAKLDQRNTASTKDWILWIAGILLTGFLAGLGAPFWYDAINGINRFAQKAKSSTKPKNE